MQLRRMQDAATVQVTKEGQIGVLNRSHSGRPILTNKLRVHHNRALNCARRTRSHATRVMAYGTSNPAATGRHAVLHDFCMCIPYGLIVAAGGLLSATWTGLPGLYIAAAGIAEVILSTKSLKAWKNGQSSSLFTVFQAAIATGIAWTAWNAFRQGISKWATGSLLGLSASAALFFIYNVAAGGNPPREEKAEEGDGGDIAGGGRSDAAIGIKDE
ncbi:hypothetical protein Ndes2437B_g04306 [Nannochloris sp. 'desiccata']